MISRFLLGTLLISVLVGGCKKDADDTEHAIYSCKDYALIENLFNDAYKVMDHVAAQTVGIRNFGCIENTVIDTSASPMTMMIDFGDPDCEDEDGMVREGILNITFTGRYKEEGTVITISPSNYKVNDIRLDGDMILTNMGESGQGNMYFEVEVVDGEASHGASNYHAYWSSNTLREWVDGDISWFLEDDVYEITGSGSGTNRNGVSFDVEIDVPLQVTTVCPWITGGELTLTPDGRPERVLNFGDGECNSAATVTVEGKSYSIAF